MTIEDLAKTAAGRCWTGYEPVPGKAPYSNDSCRPVGTTKKKKDTKSMNAQPTQKAAQYKEAGLGAILKLLAKGAYKGVKKSPLWLRTGAVGGLGGYYQGRQHGHASGLDAGREDAAKSLIDLFQKKNQQKAAQYKEAGVGSILKLLAKGVKSAYKGVRKAPPWLRAGAVGGLGGYYEGRQHGHASGLNAGREDAAKTLIDLFQKKTEQQKAAQYFARIKQAGRVPKQLQQHLAGMDSQLRTRAPEDVDSRVDTVSDLSETIRRAKARRKQKEKTAAGAQSQASSTQPKQALQGSGTFKPPVRFAQNRNLTKQAVVHVSGRSTVNPRLTRPSNQALSVAGGAVSYPYLRALYASTQGPKGERIPEGVHGFLRGIGEGGGAITGAALGFGLTPLLAKRMGYDAPEARHMAQGFGTLGGMALGGIGGNRLVRGLTGPSPSEKKKKEENAEKEGEDKKK